jgi:hypothetical protein
VGGVVCVCGVCVCVGGGGVGVWGRVVVISRKSFNNYVTMLTFASVSRIKSVRAPPCPLGYPSVGGVR